MKIQILALCCLIAIVSNAQNPTKKFMVKMYSGFQFVSTETVTENTVGQNITMVKTSTANILPISPSFTFITNKGNYHEFELANLMWREYYSRTENTKAGGSTIVTDGSKNYHNLYGLKYKYTKQLFSSKNWKLKPCLGAGVLVQLSYNAIRPLTEMTFASDETHLTDYFQIEPGFECSLIKNTSLHFSVPLTVFDLAWDQNTIYNPALAPIQQTSANFSLNFFPTFYQLKLALAYKF